MPQRFEEEEAQAILREAMHPTEPGLDLDEIVRTGAELGIPESRIREAAERVRAGRREAGLAAEYRRLMRFGFLAHALPFALVNAMMIGLALSGKIPPVALIGCVFGWGPALGFHGWATWDESSEAYRKGLRDYAKSKAPAESQTADPRPIS